MFVIVIVMRCVDGRADIFFNGRRNAIWMGGKPRLVSHTKLAFEFDLI
jgi:hypothetical protein